jgi:preprotein translocase subunit SecA
MNTLVYTNAEVAHGVYPERLDRKEKPLDNWVRNVGGGLWHRVLPFRTRLKELVTGVGRLDPTVSVLDDETLRREMRQAAPQAMRNIREAALAFALVREAAQRTLGLMPFDTQVAGAAVLMAGKLCEMQTGEGKTLTAALAACIAGVAGVPVHVVTVNDYLAGRDAQEMGPLFQFFGLSVGTITTGMDLGARREAYARDITYCTNKEVVFDYLKDRVTTSGRASLAQLKVRALLGGERHTGLLLRGLHFAIVDEADSILIDEARTPLILAEKCSSEEDPTLYKQALEIAGKLRKGWHFELNASRREIQLTEGGKVESTSRSAHLGDIWRSARAREHLVSQALRALHLFQRDQHYLVAEEKVHIIDEYTGRLLEGRTWEQGLHQMIEVKEGCPLTAQTRTLARITYQRFFRRYLHLSGMTGTAQEVKREIWSVYRLETVAIPTHRPCIRVRLPDVVCDTEEEKWQQVAHVARHLQERNRPVLIGTRSVDASEKLSSVLSRTNVEHRVLNARQDADEARVVAEAGQPGVITVATNIAGRGTVCTETMAVWFINS